MDAAVLKLNGLTSTGAALGPGRLDGLSFAPPPGALTAVIGPANAGKSALIRAIAGVAPVRGTIELDGASIARVPAHRRRFGVILQPDMLFPGMTLAQNVAFPLRARSGRSSARRALVGEALTQTGLEGHGRILAEAASPLQMRQAMLARAVVATPRLLLLDEPFAGLCPDQAASLIAALRRIHRLLGMTVLLATAAASDGLAVADHLAILLDGAIVQSGAPAEIFDQPRNVTVAALLGETNLLPGRITEIDEDLAFMRLACGPLVEVQPGPTLTVGDPCIMALRPDRIAIAAASAAAMGGHAVDATLIDAQFSGDTYRLRLLIGSGTEIVVRRPAAVGLRGLSAGASVSLAWQPHHAQAFRDNPKPAVPS